jgi:hypothetical protein
VGKTCGSMFFLYEEEKNAWSRIPVYFCFGGMGLDIEKERSEKKKEIGGPMEFIFRRCSPRHQCGCFLYTRKVFESGTGKILCLAVPDPDS